MKKSAISLSIDAQHAMLVCKPRDRIPANALFIAAKVSIHFFSDKGQLQHDLH